MAELAGSLLAVRVSPHAVLEVVRQLAAAGLGGVDGIGGGDEAGVGSAEKGRHVGPAKAGARPVKGFGGLTLKLNDLAPRQSRWRRWRVEADQRRGRGRG